MSDSGGKTNIFYRYVDFHYFIFSTRGPMGTHEGEDT